MKTYTKKEVKKLIIKAFEATAPEIGAEMINMQSNPKIIFDGEDLKIWFKKNLK